MGQVCLLDNLLSKWDRLVYSTIYLLSKWDRLVYLCPIYTRLIYSIFCRVNGNEAHLLDNLSTKWDRPIYSIFCRVNRPAQILISHRADGPHSRLLNFLSSRWAVRVNGSEHIQGCHAVNRIKFEIKTLKFYVTYFLRLNTCIKYSGKNYQKRPVFSMEGTAGQGTVSWI